MFLFSGKINLDNELVRHFLIEPCKKGVRLKGSNEEPTFSSLVALIYQHSLTKMALPVPLVIPDAGKFLLYIMKLEFCGFARERDFYTLLLPFVNFRTQ